MDVFIAECTVEYDWGDELHYLAVFATAALAREQEARWHGELDGRECISCHVRIDRYTVDEFSAVAADMS
jgi:hypothetical protein